jgi:hypothetical protein
LELEERRAIDHTLADAAYKYILDGFHIRPVAVPEDFLENRGQSALATEIARDGIEV